MKLNTLEIFALVAKYQSITETAQVLKVSKGHVSQQVKLLEQELNLTLFKRHKNKLMLTYEAEYILKHTLKLLEQKNLISSFAKSLRHSPQGTLNIISHYKAATEYLFPHLEKFSQIYPNINLNFTFIDSNAPKALEANDIVFALAGHINAPENWKRKRLTQSPMIFCGSVSYFQTHPIPRKLEDLHNHHFIAQSTLLDVNKEQHIITNSEEIKLKAHIESNSALACIELAKCHMGVVMTSLFEVKKELDQGALIEVLPNTLGGNYNDLFLYYHATEYTHPNIRHFIDFITTFQKNI